MANKKRFEDPYTTTIRMEMAEKELAEYFGVAFTDAFRHGLHSFIEVELTRREVVPEEKIQLFEAVRAKFLDDIRERFKTTEARQKLQDITTKITADARAMKETIRVWDESEERYAEIPAPLFNPAIHRRVVKQSQIEQENEDEV